MQNLFLFFATLFAFFIKGITGFGNTLVMASLYSFVVPNRLTTPVDLLVSIPTNAFIVWRERKSISLKIVLPLSFMLLAGIIPGTLLLKFGQDWLLKTVLGVVLIGLAVEMLTRKAVMKKLENERSERQNLDNLHSGSGKKKNRQIILAFIGVLSGILAGLFGIGALLVAYINRTTANKNEFRGNICCVFLVENLFRVVYYASVGILTKEILFFTAMILPALFIGMVAGIRLDAGLKDSVIQKAVIGILLLSGVSLILQNLAGKF